MKMHIVKPRGGIAAAAQRLDLEVEVAGPQSLAALEDHVFEKMCQPLFSRLLEAASRSAPKIKAGEPRIRHRDHNTATAVVEAVLAQVVRQLQTLGLVAQDPMAKSHSVLNRTGANASPLNSNLSAASVGG
jgi:hypothetical protein